MNGSEWKYRAITRCMHYYDPISKKPVGKDQKNRQRLQNQNVHQSFQYKQCGRTCIGETGRPLQVRTKEHQRLVWMGETDKLCLVQHAWEEGHMIA
ncbi:hypothetical protein Trydic_g3467 [Trypoxylus dichotomus]